LTLTQQKEIVLPLNKEEVEVLYAGEKVYLTGKIYTARDALHKMFFELLQKNKPLPVNLEGQVIYYAGPTPARPGEVVGSIGPTSSYRMDPYTPLILSKTGLKGMIGKGQRREDIKKALQNNQAVYFAAVGGAGALLAQHVERCELLAFDELGPEALYALEVKNFPVIVVNDIYGNDLYEEGPKKYRKYETIW